MVGILFKLHSVLFSPIMKEYLKEVFVPSDIKYVLFSQYHFFKSLMPTRCPISQFDSDTNYMELGAPG